MQTCVSPLLLRWQYKLSDQLECRQPPSLVVPSMLLSVSASLDRLHLEPCLPWHDHLDKLQSFSSHGYFCPCHLLAVAVHDVVILSVKSLLSVTLLLMYFKIASSVFSFVPFESGSLPFCMYGVAFCWILMLLLACQC
jgi:hypothetical protein